MSSSISAQKTSSGEMNNGGVKRAVVSLENYKKVLDIVFPRERIGSASFVILLRFAPDTEPESQIRIAKTGQNIVEVSEFSSMSGNIYQRLNDYVARGGEDDPIQMSKLIKIRTRSIKVSDAQVGRWHTGLLDSVSASVGAFKSNYSRLEANQVTFPLHGTSYDLWYQQGINEMSFSIYDQAIEVKRLLGDFKITEWMKSVEQQIR
jgi:hypothetical protein